MTTFHRSLIAAASLAVVAAPLAFASPDGDGSSPAGRPCPPAPGAAPAGDAAAPAGRRGRMGKFLRMRHERRMRGMRFLKALNLTDAQKDALKASREATAKVREDTAAQIRAVFQEARKGERTPETRKAAHEKVKALLVAARESVAPEARKILGTITPEQRQALADRAAAHGKTLDDERLLKGIERLLLMPHGRHHRRAAAGTEAGK